MINETYGLLTERQLNPMVWQSLTQDQTTWSNLKYLDKIQEHNYSSVYTVRESTTLLKGSARDSSGSIIADPLAL